MHNFWLNFLNNSDLVNKLPSYSRQWLKPAKVLLVSTWIFSTLLVSASAASNPPRFIPLPKPANATQPASTSQTKPRQSQPIQTKEILVTIKSYQNNVYEIIYQEELSLLVNCQPNDRLKWRYRDLKQGKVSSGNNPRLLVNPVKRLVGPTQHSNLLLVNSLVLRCQKNGLVTQNGNKVALWWINLK